MSAYLDWLNSDKKVPGEKRSLTEQAWDAALSEAAKVVREIRRQHPRDSAAGYCHEEDAMAIEALRSGK